MKIIQVVSVGVVIQKSHQVVSVGVVIQENDRCL